jgi:hypothetical protein
MDISDLQEVPCRQISAARRRPDPLLGHRISNGCSEPQQHDQE